MSIASKGAVTPCPNRHFTPILPVQVSKMFRHLQKIDDGVFQLKAIGARVTFLIDSGQAILIDAGFPGSSRAIIRGLSECGLSLEDIDRIVITHAHPDHSGGLAELVAETGIPVAIHSSESDIVEGKTPAPNPLRSQFLASVTRPALARLTGGPVPVDLRLEDGDIIPFPSELRVIHLPGHTAGSIALYLPEKGIIIVGDALQYKFGWRLFPPAPGVTQSPEQAMRSLEKLLPLDFHTICFSHFPPLRKDARESLKRLIQRHSQQSRVNPVKLLLRN